MTSPVSLTGAEAYEHLESIRGAQLFVLEIGHGPAMVILHGGPDFDHYYLRPELDRLGRSFRLVYYDQRGRGRSARGVLPEDVSLASELADLDAIRRSLGPEVVAILGHSWGGLLAMEYATRWPEHVSHLVLLNTAPASNRDWTTLVEHLRNLRTADERRRLRQLAESTPYRDGDLTAAVEYNRIHFRPTVKDADDLDEILRRLFRQVTSDGIRTARRIEDRLYEQTCDRDDYNLFPSLGKLGMPTLVLHGDRDLIPVGMAERIADAIPGSRFLMLEDCGHFSFVEKPEQVADAVGQLLANS